MLIKSHNKGFTLLELLVVVAIIGLLAGVVMAAVSNAREKARIAAGAAFDGNLRRTMNPIGIWNFEEGSGTVAEDISGNGNRGNFSSPNIAYTRDTYGLQSNYSLSLGTSTYYVGTNKPVGANGSSFTIAHWVKTPNANGHANTVLNTGGADGFRFGVGGSGYGITILFGDSTGYDSPTCGQSVRISDNQWHHLVGVFDRVNNTFTCYIDGKFVQTVAISSRPNMSSASAKFGHYCCSPNFVGLIDDVRIYDQTLSLADVQGIYDESKEKFAVRE